MLPAKNGRPLQNLPHKGGFVAADPPRVFRGGSDMLNVKLSRLPILVSFFALAL
jgi:hypothetical protein